MIYLAVGRGPSPRDSEREGRHKKRVHEILSRTRNTIP